MEWHVLHKLNEGQLRRMVKGLVDQLETMKNVQRENVKLQTQNNIYKLKEDKHDDKSLKREIFDLRKQLKMKEMRESSKDPQQHVVKLEQQPGATGRELRRQAADREGRLQLRKNNTELRAAMSKQEKQLTGETRVLELEVEKLQQKTSRLQRKNEELQKTKSKLQEETGKERERAAAQQQRALATEERCSRLEEQLERAWRELHIKTATKQRSEAADVAALYDKHIELVGRLIAERARLDLKDGMVKELEERNKQLLAARPLEVNPESQRVGREQGKEIRALAAQVKMLYLKAEEDERERERLVDELVAVKKRYLNGKMQNTDLREALRRSGAKQVPEEKSSGPPPRPSGLH